MPTLTNDEAVVFDWLDSWWHITSAWLADPEPLIGSDWDSLAYKAAAVVPDELHATNLQPLKDLLYAMVAFGDPSDINGPQPTAADLMERSSKAWRTYQRLMVLVQNRITQEKSDKFVKPPLALGPVEEVGPFEPALLRLLFDVDDNRTLKGRLLHRQREETQLKWYVPRDLLNALGDWPEVLRDKANDLPEKKKQKLLAFLSLH